MYFWTVRLQTRSPSLSSSPLIRSAPQSRLAVAILRMSAMVSVAIVGLDFRCALDFRVQHHRYMSRCHRNRVAGCTRSNALSRVLVTRAKATIHQRSVGVSSGRPTCRRRTSNCRRSRAFSAMSSVRDRTASRATPRSCRSVSRPARAASKRSAIVNAPRACLWRRGERGILDRSARGPPSSTARASVAPRAASDPTRPAKPRAPARTRAVAITALCPPRARRGLQRRRISKEVPTWSEGA